MTILVIGTAEDCTIRVTSQYASAHHAAVSDDEAGRWWVADLGSTNGTTLIRTGHERRVTGAHLLEPGDVIVVGRVRIPWQPPSNAANPTRVTAEVGPRLQEPDHD